MGYTHYWKHNGFTDTEWEQLQVGAREILDNTDVSLAGGLGEGSPEITDNSIWLNGVGTDGYETFRLTKDSTTFDFCKTAMKPYDKIVVDILKLARDINKSFTPTSDGEDIF